MRDLDYMRLTICRNDRPNGSFMALDMGNVDPRPGKNRISFYMYLHELIPAFQNYTFCLADGYHKADVFGDSWVFYDFELPGRGNAGVCEVKWRKLDLPRRAMAILIRYARMRMRGMSPTERAEVEISQAWRERMTTRYGVGTGQTALEVRPSAYQRYEAHIASQAFQAKLEQLVTITRNTTNSSFETATLSLTADGCKSFGFTVYAPSGRVSMYGGLINHGSEESPDWSIHT